MSDNFVNQLKTAVFNETEILKQIYHKFGDLTLLEYVTQWTESKSFILEEALLIIQEGYTKLYGTEVARQICQQIQNTPLVSTVDHHGIFGHPFFLNANLLFSLRNELKHLPVFSTSGVSLNNSSWPGCLVLTNPNSGSLERLSFFHDGHKTKTVFNAGKIGPVEVERVLEQIKHLGFLSFSQKEELTRLVEKVFLSTRVLEQNNFSDQACLISQMLWQETFPSAPKLVYLPLEEITSQIIIKDIAVNPDHILHKLFFTPTGWQLTEKYFFGLRGAFGPGRGSYLFWGVDGEDKRIAFIRQESRISCLPSAGASGDSRRENVGLKIGYSLNSEDISQALFERKIYPTSLVCFLVMLYYNFNCLGGFNQTTWLTEIKEKFIALLSEMGESGLAEQINKVVTDNFAETPLAFSTIHGTLIKPTLLDLYLNNMDYQSIENRAKKITLAQSLETELPEIYKITIPQKEQLTNLLAITSTQIAKNNGLTKGLGLL